METIFYIVNPSDAYTIVASDLEVAAVACVLLGRGQYAFEPLEGDLERVPLFLFGNPDEWFNERFGFGDCVTRVMETRAAELADCLDSCLIGNLKERREYESALALMESPEGREQFRRNRHAARRSSLNDIGSRACEMATHIREKAANPVVPAPQQVFAS